MKADVSKEEVQVTYDPKKTNSAELARVINEHTHYKASVRSDL
jgi:copper chaperone CopZ